MYKSSIREEEEEEEKKLIFIIGCFLNWDILRKMRFAWRQQKKNQFQQRYIKSASNDPSTTFSSFQFFFFFFSFFAMEEYIFQCKIIFWLTGNLARSMYNVGWVTCL